LLARASVKTPLHANISPGEYHWIGASSGMRGLNFNYVIRQDEGTVELYIDRGSEERETNKRLFDRLHGHREEIERTFGGDLSWQCLDDKRSCRIGYTVTLGGWKSDQPKWPEIQDAMIDGMVRLEKALKPQLASLKSEFVSEGA
jgi:hypothetical protein